MRKDLVQLAVDTHDNTIIYAVPESYRVSLPQLRTWIENTLFYGVLPDGFPLRGLGCHGFLLQKGELVRRTNTATRETNLLNVKYWAVDQVYQIINNQRFRVANKMLMQQWLYDAKVEEAKIVLASQHEERKMSDFEATCPMLYNEAKDKGMGLVTVAQTVMLAREDQLSFLKRTEIMRIAIAAQIEKATTEQEVHDFLQKGRQEFYIR